jgi:hypothetical protein
MTTADLVRLKPRVADVYARLTRPDMKEAFERLKRGIDLVEPLPPTTTVKNCSIILAVISDEEDVLKDGFDAIYKTPEAEHRSIRLLHAAADELNGLGV